MWVNNFLMNPFPGFTLSLCYYTSPLLALMLNLCAKRFFFLIAVDRLRALVIHIILARSLAEFSAVSFT